MEHNHRIQTLKTYLLSGIKTTMHASLTPADVECVNREAEHANSDQKVVLLDATR